MQAERSELEVLPIVRAIHWLDSMSKLACFDLPLLSDVCLLEHHIVYFVARHPLCETDEISDKGLNFAA